MKLTPEGQAVNDSIAMGPFSAVEIGYGWWSHQLTDLKVVLHAGEVSVSFQYSWGRTPGIRHGTFATIVETLKEEEDASSASC